MCADFSSLLTQHFNADNLERVFTEKVQFQSATGTDGITARKFGDIATAQIQIALRKILASTYHFTRYREKLILKSRDKPPRVIAIPTVRDKLVLRALNECLSQAYHGCHPPPINRTIARIKEGLRGGKYTGYLRLDIQDFYPTIRHEPLLERLEALSLPPEIMILVERAIQQRTYKVKAQSDNLGIPQGLPISNAVANIYLEKIDEHWAADTTLLYSRFVDDILILGTLDKLPPIHAQITTMFEKLGLTAHPLESGKSALKPISEPVAYLGYRLAPNLTSVREASLHKLKESLIAIFVSHARNKKKGYRKKLLWRLNLRVTGCTVNKQRFGWLHFFSEIDDLSLLKSLDVFVARQLTRWQIKRVKPRKFVRTYFEVRYRSESTRYIPSFDGYELAEKAALLKNIFGVKITSGWTEKDISREFFLRLRRETISLEEDLVRLS
ncbi:MAG: reverse transcriptase domain-containing protein [Candidatus Didemnitutus sp.]|nr:reverse transcriptase domain-containing protein [Candidatus Didemnitutus sp.]